MNIRILSLSLLIIFQVFLIPDGSGQATESEPASVIPVAAPPPAAAPAPEGAGHSSMMVFADYILPGTSHYVYVPIGICSILLSILAVFSAYYGYRRFIRRDNECTEMLIAFSGMFIISSYFSGQMEYSISRHWLMFNTGAASVGIFNYPSRWIGIGIALAVGTMSFIFLCIRKTK